MGALFCFLVARISRITSPAWGSKSVLRVLSSLKVKTSGQTRRTHDTSLQEGERLSQHDRPLAGSTCGRARSLRRQPRHPAPAPERHPAARRGPAGAAHSRRAAPPPPSPLPSPDAQGPTQELRPQNGCRRLRHVTPLCLSGPRTPRDPGTGGRGRRQAFEGAPPGRSGPGPSTGEAGDRPGRRPRVGGGEKMAAILCGSAAPPPPRAAEGAGLAAGRTGELTRTDSSSFSIPVGICGTARFIEAYSCRSGRSSQRKTGSGFEASSARARNDSLLISGAADTSPLWGNGPGQRDHGEPGCRSPLACRCRGLGGGAQARRPGPDTSREGGRLCRSAPRSLALFNTPWPTWRTLKLHCALFSQPQPFPTLHRAAARARAGGARARAGAGAARSARPANPRPAGRRPRLLRLPRRLRPATSRRPARSSDGRRCARLSAPRGPWKGRRQERPGCSGLRPGRGHLSPRSWPRGASAAQCGRSRNLEIKMYAKSQAYT